MGAVASIIYLAQSSQKTNIKGLILDSPFKNLRQLIKEIAAERTGLPKLFFEPVMYFVNE